MMRAIKILSILGLMISNELIGQSGYSLNNLPNPGDFPAHRPPSFSAKGIQDLLFPMNKDLITTLQSQYNKGANFAGHYTVVSIGCGEDCETLWIFNPKTGDIISHVISHYGSQYSLLSKLLVVNTPSAEAKGYYNISRFSPYWQNLQTEYYVIDGNSLRQIFKVPMAELLK